MEAMKELRWAKLVSDSNSPRAPKPSCLIQAPLPCSCCVSLLNTDLLCTGVMLLTLHLEASHQSREQNKPSCWAFLHPNLLWKSREIQFMVLSFHLTGNITCMVRSQARETESSDPGSPLQTHSVAFIASLFISLLQHR